MEEERRQYVGRLKRRKKGRGFGAIEMNVAWVIQRTVQGLSGVLAHHGRRNLLLLGRERQGVASTV